MKANKSYEVKYRKELLGIVNSLKKDILTNIIPILKQYEQEYVNDSYATTLEQVFENLRSRYNSVSVYAKSIASEFVGQVDKNNREKFYKTVENSIGVNLSAISRNEGLGDTLVASTRENVSLIKSIPEEYFKRVETLVFRSTIEGHKSGSIIKEIQKIKNLTTYRAKLIARDQSSKLNAAITETRQKNLGIEEYIWRTSGDERVRSSHSDNNGKTFRWDTPPKNTGHPGQSIQCRCVAQPIIKL